MVSEARIPHSYHPLWHLLHPTLSRDGGRGRETGQAGALTSVLLTYSSEVGPIAAHV